MPPAAPDEHAQMMKNPGMEHDSRTRMAPGRTQRISWTFSESGDFLPARWPLGCRHEASCASRSEA
jgi:hypothetical protein